MAARKTIEWYENQLDNNKNLTPAQIESYESEIERLADVEFKVHQKGLIRQQEEKQRALDIKAQLEAGDVNVIDIVGIPEFGSDYELCQEADNHVVYSKVALENQENRHVHNSEKDAIKHYRKLIWDRLYTKYVRSGELDSLRTME